MLIVGRFEGLNFSCSSNLLIFLINSVDLNKVTQTGKTSSIYNAAARNTGKRFWSLTAKWWLIKKEFLFLPFKRVTHYQIVNAWHYWCTKSKLCKMIWSLTPLSCVLLFFSIKKTLGGTFLCFTLSVWVYSKLKKIFLVYNNRGPFPCFKQWVTQIIFNTGLCKH